MFQIGQIHRTEGSPEVIAGFAMRLNGSKWQHSFSDKTWKDGCSDIGISDCRMLLEGKAEQDQSLLLWGTSSALRQKTQNRIYQTPQFH
jgi:hypothetical protein